MIPYDGTYVIEGARRIGTDHVLVRVIVNPLQRLHVTVPYARSSSADLDTVIRAAVAGLNRPTKPLSPYLKAG